jgi:hypothetical protein
MCRWWRSDGGNGDAMTTTTTTTTVAGSGRAAGGGDEGGGQRRRGGLNSVVVFLLNSAFCNSGNGWCSPPQSDGNSLEVLPVSGAQISKKRVSASLRAHKTKSPKKSQTHRQTANRY